MNHFVETWGFTFFNKDGSLFSYFADTAWDDSLLDQIRLFPGVVIADLNGEFSDLGGIVLKRFTEPQLFEDVTVFFSDFVGFTSMSTTVEPEHLISELNDIFTRFDEIMMGNGCERIKTIGDAFLSVSGITERTNENTRI